MIKVGKFNIRIVPVGGKYGYQDSLTNSDRPLVEFYDSTQDPAKFGELGQFVTCYYIFTMIEREENVGLCLLGHVPEWTVPAADMREVIAYLKGWTEATSQ